MISTEKFLNPKTVSHSSSTKHYLYLAPIRGVTDALFRNVFYHHFDGIDAAIAPFITPQTKTPFSDRALSDVLPQNNTPKPLIPQLLHTSPKDFLVLAARLTDLGFTHINWNLGCPAPMVAKKKRGSGLLPYPEEIVSLLEKVIPQLKIQLSIKTRLGYAEKNELLQLLPLLNDFPLKEIIIHTRLGTQLYRGRTDPEGFAACREISNHTLVYNGDIFDRNTFESLAARFPEIDRWMLGRVLLMNPFLAEELKGSSRESGAKRLERLYSFHEDLYEQYKKRLSGPGHLLGRMKQLWIYLISSFPGKEKSFKNLKKSNSTGQYLDSVQHIFDR
jgi:tRNA-dihydrouridine synthase B